MKPGLKPTHPLPRIFRNIVDAPMTLSSCWVWRGKIAPSQYPRVCWNTKSIEAHRVICQELFGQIPIGYEVDHLCRNRQCVRPSHLEAVTKQENNRRSQSGSAINRRKTHCHRGHELIAPNIYTSPKAIARGKRICKICNRLWKRQRYALRLRSASL